MESFAAALQSDCRQLISDSKRSDGLGSQISGFFSTPENPVVKEAAERAILKLRSCAGPQELGKIRESPDILRPFLLACETRNHKLVINSLGCVQKLLANDAVAMERVPDVLAAMHQAEKLGDEAIKLKLLQTALTLLQSKLGITDEGSIGIALGICFRILAQSRNTDSVLSTAAAAVRQGVAIVFERFEGKIRESPAPQAAAEGAEGGGGGAGAAGGGGGGATPGVAQHDTAAVEKLLEDIVALVNGKPAAWLSVSHLQRSFALDLLELVVLNSSLIFHTQAAMQAQLQNSVCPFVVRQLSDGFAADSSHVMDAGETRQLLRIASSLLLSLHEAIPESTAPLVHVTLVGASSSGTFWQRSHALKVLRQLCADPKVLLHLQRQHVSQAAPSPGSEDPEASEAVDVVREMVECFAETALSYMKLVAPEDPTLGFLAALYSHKAASGMHVDAFHESMMANGVGSVEEAGALLAMQAVDCMLAVAAAIDSLADKLVVAGEPQKEAPLVNAGRSGREDLPCLAEMVDTNWKRILSTLFEVLSRTDGESLVLSLVRGYQLMIQTCGAIGADESPLPEATRDRLTKARDGFLSSLCEFTLSSDRDLRAYLLDASSGSSGPGTPSSSSGGGFKEKMAGMGEKMSQRMGRPGSGHLAGGAGASSSAASSSGGHSGRDKQEHLHQSSLPQGDSDARVLTPKNVQCMRALFNCAHRLCCSLGTSWAIVLSNLVSLDRILQSPHTTTLEISAQTDTSLSADLAILQAAANQLFESTAELPTEVVLGMMASLRDISTRMLSDAAMRPSHVRLFALERLVETLLVNCHRVQDLWGVFLTHILEVVNTDPGMFRKLPLQVRAAGMDALDRATMGILTTTVSWRPGEDGDDHEPPPEFRRASGPPFSPSKLEGPVSDEQSMALERMVLLPLEELYKQAREVDVRLGVLRIVMHCLQQHGDHLRTGWSPILRLLREVPARDEADVLALAFQSVQLLSSEYMAMFPEELQIGCIQVATMYASQQTDLNISLTSIGLLWNTADLMATTLGTKIKDSEERSLEPAAALGAGEVQEDLLQSLFSALQKLSGDTRPEVRNSAVRTLFRVMSSTGERLAPTTWENCLWGLLFPLMNQTSHMSATSCREENEAAELGKEKGRSVKMLVHHSRNSEQKQWDETLVLVLNGMGRLLRVFLPTLAGIPRISEAWDDIMQVVETTMMSSRKELAMASISMLSSILQSPEACNAMSPGMWKRAMTVFANGAQEAAARPQAMPLQARTELVTALEALYTVAPSRFDDADAAALLRWSSAMMRNPHAPGDGPVGAGVLPPLQKVVLRAMESIAPQLVTHHPELCTNLLDMLILLFPRHPRDPLPETPPLDEAANEGGVPGTNPATLKLLQERALALIITLYKQHAPWRVRASRFGPVVLALGNCMVTRWQPLGDIPDADGGRSLSSGGMWRAASRALVAVVNAGLPAVNIAYVNSDTSDPPDEVWDALLSAFGGFLIGPEIMGSESSALGAPVQQVADCFGEPVDGGPADAAQQLSEDMELEAAVLDSLTDGVLPGAVHAPEECKKRLVQIVEMGVARGPRRRPALLGSQGKLKVNSDFTNSFPQLCLRKLFVLCSRGVQAPGAHGTMLEVACLTLPMLLSSCSSILAQYISDENALPSDRSMPRPRYDLVMCMLEVVSSLKVAPCVVDAAVEAIGNPRLAMLLATCREARGGGGAMEHHHQAASSDPWSSVTPPGTPSAGQGPQTQQEATHLLLLYPELVKGVTARDARIRESITSMLAEVGTELGLIAPAAAPE